MRFPFCVAFYEGEHLFCFKEDSQIEDHKIIFVLTDLLLEQIFSPNMSGDESILLVYYPSR